MTAEWVEAVAAAVEAVAWPAAFVIVFLFLRRFITGAISQGRDVKINIAGTEVSVGGLAQGQSDNIADLLEKVSGLEERLQSLEPPAGTLERTRALVDHAAARVLWVDDTPTNNLLLVDALNRLNVAVDIATSTPDAIRLLRDDGAVYAAIVTDMGRPGDGKAGITLARAMRSQLKMEQPILVFCGSWAATNLRDEALAAGITELTSSGTHLLAILRHRLDR